MTFFCYRIAELGARIALLSLFAVCTHTLPPSVLWCQRTTRIQLPAPPELSCPCHSREEYGLLWQLHKPSRGCAWPLIWRLATWGAQVIRGAWVFAVMGFHAVAVLLAIWMWQGKDQAAVWAKVRQPVWPLLPPLLKVASSSLHLFKLQYKAGVENLS